jgi:hypothetical protein
MTDPLIAYVLYTDWQSSEERHAAALAAKEREVEELREQVNRDRAQIAKSHEAAAAANDQLAEIDKWITKAVNLHLDEIGTDTRPETAGLSFPSRIHVEVCFVLALYRDRMRFLKSKGLTVGLLKDQNGTNLAYVIEPESELCDLVHLRKLADAEADLARVKAALAAKEAELREMKRLYELRGKALQRPCGYCGHEPLVITTNEQA